MHAAAGACHDVVQERHPARVIGADGVVGTGDGVVAHVAGAPEVEHGDRRRIRLHVGKGVVVEVERAAARGVDAAQVDVLHGDVVHLQVVEGSEVVVGDDAVARIEIRPGDDNTADQRGVIAIQGQTADGDVVGLDEDDVAAAGA